MDTLTHALSGALMARAVLTPQLPKAASRWGTLIGALAAAFPDIDFILRWWVDSLTYLNLHRGLTHSLILLPLWATGLTFVSRLLLKKQLSTSQLFLLCSLGILIHICGDVITAYGTRIFAPISYWRAAWPTTFIIDLIFTGIVITGVALSGFINRRNTAAGALAILFAYVMAQGALQRQAHDLAKVRAGILGIPAEQAFAIPQPFSPFHWKLILRGANEYHIAHTRLRTGNWWSDYGEGWWSRISRAYKTPTELEWQRVPVFSGTAAQKALAQTLWHTEDFDGFREFAVYPAVYRVDEGERQCFWFTDLRFVVPNLTPPFRYGLCTVDHKKQWSLERMPRN